MEVNNPKYNGFVRPTDGSFISFKPTNYTTCALTAFPYFPFWVRLDPPLSSVTDEIHQWCEEHFGPDALKSRQDTFQWRYWVDLKCEWIGLTGDYLFFNCDHAFEFRMRWS
jgi:hypothetical protein